MVENIKKRGDRKKEHAVLVIGLVLFLGILLFVNPSYTAYTSMNKILGNASLISFLDLIIIIIGIILLYKLIVKKK